MQRKQQGFTLIELVIVIVILGILSAFALPRFADLGGDARAAAIEGAAGAMRSASAITRSACLAASTDDCDENATADSIDLEGQPVSLAYGYPDGAGILVAAQIDEDDYNISGDGSSGDPLLVQADGAEDASECQISFIEAQGASTPPDFDINTDSC